jgi:two-component system chemotaxis sensor kinase CheA
MIRRFRRFWIFCHVNETHLQNAGRKVDRLCEWMDGDYRHMSLLTDDMQNGVRRVRMVPVSTLFDLFPRMIRDISREQGKQARLVLEGADTEIDRQVLEGLKDPLTHLLRNAIDHGIEPPEARRRRKKPEEGTIRLEASQRGNHIVLEVSDDGAGINLQAVRRAAVRNHLLTPADAENISVDETVDLVFQSGLSTHVSVTDLSGRGVGMDVVREQLEKLHGQVKTQTEMDHGTTFTLILPLTLATSHVLMLKVADQVVAVPTTSVERLLQMKPDEIRRMEGKPAVSINGRALPLISMAQILALPEREVNEEGPQKIAVVVLGAVEKRLAFQVDGFLGAQEAVVKNLGPQLQRVPNISGATILGTGRVVMILNAGSMIYASQGVKGAGLLSRMRVEAAQAKKVLVVDDSITTRTLEKNILENAGYQVGQAADGMEGWERMQEETYDAVVFDIEMPRMDGFQLTEKVRRDNRFEHLPIVLVTSLESPEDKIRGMEAGADVYITKGTFDQTELLETIERLIG